MDLNTTQIVHRKVPAQPFPSQNKGENGQVLLAEARWGLDFSVAVLGEGERRETGSPDQGGTIALQCLLWGICVTKSKNMDFRIRLATFKP